MEVCDIAPRMNARIRAPDAGDRDLLPERLPDGIGHALLNGRQIFLHLPAVEARAVIAENECNVQDRNVLSV